MDGALDDGWSVPFVLPGAMGAGCVAARRVPAGRVPSGGPVPWRKAGTIGGCRGWWDMNSKVSASGLVGVRIWVGDVSSNGSERLCLGGQLTLGRILKGVATEVGVDQPSGFGCRFGDGILRDGVFWFIFLDLPDVVIPRGFFLGRENLWLRRQPGAGLPLGWPAVVCGSFRHPRLRCLLLGCGVCEKARWEMKVLCCSFIPVCVF